MVAVHLDMIEDAEALLKQCGRYDLLNQLYQASGNWEKALELAKTKDGIRKWSSKCKNHAKSHQKPSKMSKNDGKPCERTVSI